MRVCAHMRVYVESWEPLNLLLNDYYFTINDSYHDNHNPDTNINKKWYQERNK